MHKLLLATIGMAFAAHAAAAEVTCRDVEAALAKDAAAAGAPTAVAVVKLAGGTECFAAYAADGARRPDRTTIYGVGSVTKQMTAYALLSQLKQQRRSVRTAASEIDPSLRGPIRSATVHELLSQTSGLADRPGLDGPTDPGALKTMVATLTAENFVAPAGLGFSYSNLGYSVAGHLLAQARRQSYADAMAASVFRPFGMSTATFAPSRDRLGARLALPHEREGDEPAKPREALPANAALAPAGYAYMSVADGAKWLDVLLGRAGDQAIVRQMSTRQVPIGTGIFGEGGGYGYGLFVTSTGGRPTLEHAGTLPGYTADIAAQPSASRGYVAMTNLENVRFLTLRSLVVGNERPPAVAPAPAAAAVPPAGQFGRNRFTVEISAAPGGGWVASSPALGPDPRPIVADDVTGRRWRLAAPPGGRQLYLVVLRRGEKAWLQHALWIMAPTGEPAATTR